MKNIRTPHTLRTLAVAVALTATLAACGSDDTTDTADTAAVETTAAGSETTAAASETTAAAGETPTAEAVTVESGYSSGVSSLGTRFTSAGAVVTNTSTQLACGVKVEFALLDASGALIDTKTETVAFVAAGVAANVAPSGLGGGTETEPGSMEATVTEVRSFTTAATCDPSIVQGLSLETADVVVDELTYIRGSLNNTTDTAAEKPQVDCVLRDTAGAIVGGDKTVVREPVEAGATAEFKVRMLWAPDTAATAECSAIA
ncbi:MAG: hypothetical protein RL238_484 [Actinomycetota bacterium]